MYVSFITPYTVFIIQIFNFPLEISKGELKCWRHEAYHNRGSVTAKEMQGVNMNETTELLGSDKYSFVLTALGKLSLPPDYIYSV